MEGGAKTTPNSLSLRPKRRVLWPKRCAHSESKVFVFAPMECMEMKDKFACYVTVAQFVQVDCVHSMFSLSQGLPSGLGIGHREVWAFFKVHEIVAQKMVGRTPWVTLQASASKTQAERACELMRTLMGDCMTAAARARASARSTARENHSRLPLLLESVSSCLYQIRTGNGSVFGLRWFPSFSSKVVSHFGQSSFLRGRFAPQEPRLKTAHE